MFGTKKNTLPPRPNPPNLEEIVEDLAGSANKDDVAFKILAQGKQFFCTVNLAIQ